jgi:hypothetical protein
VPRSDEPQQNQPRELYPEWTTHPRGVQPRVLERREPVRLPRQEEPRATRGSWFPLLAAAVVVLSVAFTYGFFFLERRTQRQPDLAGGTASFDAGLQVDAARRIEREKDLRGLPLTIHVTDQVVDVSGRVPDDRTRESVLNVLRMTPGVKGVVDHLQVGAPPTVPEKPSR